MWTCRCFVPLLAVNLSTFLLLFLILAFVSSRREKKNITLVEDEKILEKLLDNVHVYSWTYNAEKDDVTHVGPIAEDFYRAFGLGQNERTISTVDADGVALASVRALAKYAKQMESRLDALESRLEALEKKGFT
eukprot:CAMPEP_0113905964 /NCGR_PEP_ID=MMETSP0780_2-20120614/24410_1 /TAXON_ID=652834 /ORGANISM="Palpitomonas bilix" /LENGTH=133 /DNA_ID=CAMNT_0000900363 /DNA_START=250 /DNA_END=651 /DNA_ORIENTATION=- /assembly_acc=CAM_ASM_000599